MRLGFASLISQGEAKPDPVAGDIPTLGYLDYTGDYILRVPVSLVLILGFALSGLGSIVGVSAALYFFVIKNDKGDAEDTTASSTVPTEKPATSASELNLESKALLRRILEHN